MHGKHLAQCPAHRQHSDMAAIMFAFIVIVIIIILPSSCDNVGCVAGWRFQSTFQTLICS